MIGSMNYRNIKNNINISKDDVYFSYKKSLPNTFKAIYFQIFHF